MEVKAIDPKKHKSLINVHLNDYTIRNPYKRIINLETIVEKKNKIITCVLILWQEE
jgi:uncharacterized protein (DUF2344 family)